jgi:two-component system NtrC family sensor kinase
VLINAFAARDPQDRVQQYRGLMLDISGLKTYQAELQRERDFSGKILNNTQSLILVVDPAGNITYANRRWFDLGYRQRQLLNIPMVDLVPAARQSALVEAFQITLQGQQVDNLDLPVMRGDGRQGQFSVNLSPMRDEQGQVGSVVAVMTDITDSATLQAKLMHAEKMAAVGQLVSGVAHELNNPLTSISGFAELLLDETSLHKDARSKIEKISRESRRMQRIIDNLLRFARRKTVEYAPIDLELLLRDAVGLYEYRLRSQNINLQIKVDPTLPKVVGDEDQMKQVFVNLLSNAVDALAGCDAQRITVEMFPRSEKVVVRFVDSGAGFSDPNRAFDPFYTTKPVGKGSGLGLSICYGLIKEHGGEISVQNLQPTGAAITIELPRTRKRPLTAAAAVGSLT